MPFEPTRDQLCVLNKLRKRRHVLMCGAAGCGKTETIRWICSANDLRVKCAAAVGLAAQNLPMGQTIASLIGLGLLNPSDKKRKLDDAERMFGPPRYERQKLRRDAAIRRLTGFDVLILDECSMLTDFDLEMLDRVLRLARRKPAIFMGGVTLLASGDFRQLPPIKTSQENPSFLSGKYVACFDRVILGQIFRQKDREFVERLHRLGRGEPNEADTAWFKSRERDSPKPEDMALFATNAAAEEYNASRLAEIESPEIAFDARWGRRPVGTSAEATKLVSLAEKHPQLAELQREYGEDSKRPVRKRIALRAGVPVMVRANTSVNAVPLSNGTMATFVSKTCAGEALIRLPSGQEVRLKPHRWEKECDDGVFVYEQIPLIVAYALTIDKAQGQQFERLWVDFSRLHGWARRDANGVNGRVYVATSRVTSAAGFTCKGYSPAIVRADPAANAFYSSTGQIPM